MKKIFMALSIVVLAACSDNGIGGYTNSIVKSNNESNTKTTFPQKTLHLMKSSTSLDEDLASLDDDALREKLMNTDPRPRAISAYASTPSCYPPDPISTLGPSDACYGPYPLFYSSYTGEIKDFEWHSIIPSFNEKKGYQYGFDRDPTDKDPVVYISVETGPESKTDGKAYFIPRLPTESYDKFRLIHISRDPKIEIDLKDGSEASIEKEGTYMLQGCSPLYSTFCNTPVISNLAWTNLQRKITLKAYPPITKHIIYAQLDGDGWETDDTNCDKGFTENCVRTYFDEKVFNQAVVKVDIGNIFEDEKYKDASFEIKKDYRVEIELTAPTDDVAKFLEEQAYNYVKDKDPKYWHFVYAINKERKRWHLKRCSMIQGDLSTCPGFDPEAESSNTTYYMYSDYVESNCLDGKKTKGKIKKDENNAIQVYIKQVVQREDGKPSLHYYAYDKKNKK